jgi:uncharacterized secreted protein with C-terminal beta-propeller domain
MEDVLSDFIADYYKKNPQRYYGYPMIMEDSVMSRESVGTDASKSSDSAVNSPSLSAVPEAGGGGAKDFSQTNVQFGGVDESEIVKTDGSYSYFYNAEDRRVYVTDVRDPKNVSVVKKIKVPESYANPELYLSDGKLVLFATKYQELRNPHFYWFDRASKSVVVVYDVRDPANPKIDRFLQIDGAVSQSRRIGNHLYLLSNAQFSFPYERYYRSVSGLKSGATPELDTVKIDKDFNMKKVMPKKVELSSDSGKTANFLLNGKRMPYRLESGDAASCTEVEYVLPDSATLEKYSFQPTFTTLSVIDLANPEAKTKSKVFFGDVAEIMMTEKSLFVTSQLYSPTPWRCPDFARCVMPFWNAGFETLAHKFSISGTSVKYAATAVIPGTPLNKYSMDEGADGTFRIVTSEQGEKPSTRVSVLDSKLSLLGTIANIAPGETFQSSRFIGDKLYLVTFERIDPLFVIDVSDAKNPRIEGELKIPGYSVYLHPYAPGKLIGLGYDTLENRWGGTQNAGLKVDLYDVSDVKKPKQLKTLTIGSVGSSSDALWNPKLFTWNASKKLLMLPATVMENAGDANDVYRSKDAFQGTLVISVNEGAIAEVARLSHIVRGDIAAERKKECARYAQPTVAPKCEKVIGGGEYCPSSYNYVPPYCYESATDGEYFASHIWSYQKFFVLRNLYLDDVLYTISNQKMVGHDMTKGYSAVSETVWE